MERYDSDVEILDYYDYDLYANRKDITEDILSEIMYHCRDDVLCDFYQKNKDNGIFDDDFYKKLDASFKNQIKEGVDEYVHALYMLFFSLMRIKYGKQTCVDIRVSKYVLEFFGTYCALDYHQFVPLSYTNKLFEIAKHDVSKRFKIPMEVLPKEIPDDWTINRITRWNEWTEPYIESCLKDEKKIRFLHLCGDYSFYTREHWLDKKLPKIEFDF